MTDNPTPKDWLTFEEILERALSGKQGITTRLGPLPYANDELEALAKHCTEEEDAAKKVERLVRKSAAAILLESGAGFKLPGR